MAGRFLPQEKIQTLSNAYDFANKITDLTNDPKVVLEKAGITKKDLEKAKALINNPLFSMLLGEKKQAVLEGLNKAENFFNGGNNSLAEQAPASELEQLQANLARLK